MSANVDGMVREGMNAFKNGKKEDARALLMRAVEIDPYNEQGWLWLSAVVDGPEDQRTCLENVLAINPNNAQARNGIDALTGGVSLNTSAPAAAANPFSSVEWDQGGLETSSPSATSRGPEISTDEYDDWMTNLNLSPGAAAAEVDDSAGIFTASPFDNTDSMFGSDDDDMFSGPFGADTRASTAINEPAFNPPPAQPVQEPASARRSPAPAPASNDDLLNDAGGLFYSGGYAAESMLDEPEEANELMEMLPPEITATRIPGSVEGTPIGLIIGAAVLLLLNLAAVGLLVARFMPA